MHTYTTLEGRVLDLSRLTPEEKHYFEECWAAYLAGEESITFANKRVSSESNPLLKPTGGVVTRPAWEHPLLWALRDLADRLGIRQGRFQPRPEDRPDREPLEDEWLPVSEAAARKGVTTVGLHGAIKRGDVIARPAKEGGSWLAVSRNSLDAWELNPRRQRAGRKAG